MANVEEKNKALKLRLKGKSISEIAEKIDIPKSTISIWCRNVKLKREYIDRLAKRQISGSYKGRMKFLERIRNERLLQTEKLRKEGLGDVKHISKRDLFIAGIAMYLSEGATSDCGEEVSFTNSDFRAVLFMKKWFMKICGVATDRFIVQIRINRTHKDKVGVIEKYWSKIIGVPSVQFTKTILIKSKSKKVYPKENIYYGTVRLKIRQGTQLRRRINGWIEGLLKT
ncbi:MAG: helix-turn-helix domain-containing protein [Patescibacteria group bacterium]